MQDAGLVVRRIQVAIDCVDPEQLASFWSTVLDYVIEPPPAGYASWQDFSRAVGDEGESWSAVVDPSGLGPRLLFHRVPEPKITKNRLHLDIRISDDSAINRQQVDAEVVRLQSLGATRLRSEADEHDYFVVLADPEGNEFCIN